MYILYVYLDYLRRLKKMACYFNVCKVNEFYLLVNQLTYKSDLSVSFCFMKVNFNYSNCVVPNCLKLKVYSDYHLIWL